MEVRDFGVTRLSLVSVRAQPSDKAEQVTQLLFGDHYYVIEQTKDRKWLKIKMNFDHYEGWIDVQQHHAISKEYFEYLDRAEFKITTDLTSSILYNKNQLIILLGSMIPISSSELFKMEEQFAFNGEAKNLGQKREFEYIKSVAQKYFNAPYQWGGRSPFGIDCSGFTQIVFKVAGYKLLRDAAQQATQGKAVKELKDALPGDLVFFKDQGDKISHVGILLYEQKIIHVSGRVRVDQLEEEGIVTPDTTIRNHSLALIRRILPEEN